MAESKTLRQVGRPRDPAIESRVFDETIRVFGREGWSGFSIEKVARNSSTGKASIYSRWKTREELLLAALNARIIDIEDFNSGHLRQDLVNLGMQAIELYLGPAGLAAARIALEVELVPSLKEFTKGWSKSRIRAARAIVERGIERGEFNENISAQFVINTVWGGAANFAATQMPRGQATAHERGRTYVEALVDLLLVGRQT